MTKLSADVAAVHEFAAEVGVTVLSGHHAQGVSYDRARLLGHNARMDEFVVGVDHPESGDVRALLDKHLAFAKEHSPPEDVHALDIEGLKAKSVSFFSIREHGALLGIGALKQLDEVHAEIKSMHTVEEARGRGVGRAMVDHLVDVARVRGCHRVSLETGSMPAFAPALALYASAGFETCEPFGEYRPSPNSVYLNVELDHCQRPAGGEGPDLQ